MIHYDRLPYLARGRHGSRVQRKNARLLVEWQRAKSLARSWPQLDAPAWLHLIQHVPAWLIEGQTSGLSSGSTSYDGEGRPIGLIQGSLLLADIETRRVGLDTFGDLEVSTVHIPDTAHYTADGRPLIYETMLFTEEGPTQRWLTTTRKRAERQHAQVCNMVRRGELNK